MKKVAILYGWCEGPRLARDLKKALEVQGYSITRDTEQADCIIAHSLGCYLIPRDTLARKILLVGLPYGPRKQLPLLTLHKVFANFFHSLREGAFLYWLRKGFLNSIYFFQTSHHNLSRLNDNNYLPDGKQNEVVLIKNEDDHIIQEATAHDLATRKGWRLAIVPGRHDDLWMNPEKYVHILCNISE